MNTNRRIFLKSIGLFSGVSVLYANQVFALFSTQNSVWDMQLLRNNVGYFIERGGTIGWMVSEDGIVVIDSQFPEQSGHLIDEIKKKSDKPVDVLLNTHHHGDHTAGNIAFKGLAKKIVAHENSKKYQMISAKNRGTETKQLYPDITFTNDWSQKIGKERIKAYHFGPAHTSGDSVIHFENANIVHMGDLIFNRRFPYIDTAAGSNIENWISTLEKVRSTFDKDTLFIFGHSFDPKAITGSKEDLKAMENFLDKLLVYVGKNIKAGKSQEELLKINSIPGAEEWKGQGIERGIKAAWTELTTKNM
jgi:glyoxylase-like metal-dependent hydrolase (beta-lactamase superfamily II)